MIAFRRIRVWIAGAALALAGVAVQAQENNLPRVLGPALSAPVLVTAGEGVTIRARTANPDFTLIEELARRMVDPQERPRFIIDLFPGLDLEAEVIHTEVREHGSTVFARLTEVELGSAMFTYEAGVLTATVDSPDGNYAITRQANGVYQVAQLALHRLPAEKPPRQAGSAAELPESDVPVDSGRLIDVMIVWTPSAQTAGGGAAALQSLAQASVDNANLTYLNSGIAQRLRLVHRQQVSYTERTTCPGGGTKFDCALDDITESGDGFMDDVHTLRDTHGADLVSLFINDSAYCGLGWLPLPSAATAGYGFSVLDYDFCPVANKTFVHELGHNMGAHHDPYVAPGPGAYAYSHGIVNLASRWRDVMAYVNQCFDTSPFTDCPKIQYMSTPKLTYGGAALGDASVRNNTHTLNKTAKAVAAYRPTVHPVPQRFTDVATNHPFYGHIEFFAQAGITSGCGIGIYCPNSPVTRAQMAPFLERAMKASNWTPPAATGLFTDVPPGTPFRDYIEALKNDGITAGCTATTYCPNAAVTRAQMAAFVLRARCGSAYLPNMPGSQTFSDVPLNHPLVRYIQKLYSLGITGGCATNPLRYCPDQAVTRGEMAVFIERAYPFLTPTEVCTP